MEKHSEVVWGARAIGAVIGLGERQTHYLLEAGAIRAAHKATTGKRSRWFASVSGLRNQFCLSGTTNNASDTTA
jgi:hypothetical protein